MYAGKQIIKKSRTDTDRGLPPLPALYTLATAQHLPRLPLSPFSKKLEREGDLSKNSPSSLTSSPAVLSVAPEVSAPAVELTTSETAHFSSSLYFLPTVRSQTPIVLDPFHNNSTIFEREPKPLPPSALSTDLEVNPPFALTPVSVSAPLEFSAPVQVPASLEVTAPLEIPIPIEGNSPSGSVAASDFHTTLSSSTSNKTIVRQNLDRISSNSHDPLEAKVSGNNHKYFI